MAVGDSEQAGVHGPRIAIANQDNDVTGFGLVGKPNFIDKALNALKARFGPTDTLSDLEKLANPGTTAMSPDGKDAKIK